MIPVIFKNILCIQLYECVCDYIPHLNAYVKDLTKMVNKKLMMVKIGLILHVIVIML
jgi:hypothetical protein